MPPIERRRDRWRQEIGQKLEELENAGHIEIDELVNNGVFTTTLLQASTAAMRNHQEEKIEALRNAVINATQPDPPDESVQMIFINLLDTLFHHPKRIVKHYISHSHQQASFHIL